MDPQTPNLPETAPLAPPIPPETPKDKHGITIAALAIFILLALSAVAFLYYQNQQLKSMLAGYQPTSQPDVLPKATPDPTANWKTYANSAHGVTFKYSPDWVINDKGDKDQYNAQIILNKDKAEIRMLFNMDGIGGKGQTYQGSPFVVDGNNLYRFSKTNSYNNTQEIGISTSLTNTLGVFEVNGKTYSITLTYPVADSTANSLENEFDQILSTFKFTDSTGSPSASPVACTMEAKICPDGSSVGRVGPNCEFAPCPTP